jgi:phosphotransacetylase
MSETRYMNAKTVAERQRDLRESRKQAGLKELRNLWCHPDDEERIRQYAATLHARRERKGEQKA